MPQFVVSKMSNSMRYQSYEISDDVNKLPIPRVKTSILINGGAGLPSIRSGFGEMTRDESGTPIWTADGIVTPVSDEQVEMLLANKVFQKHLKSNLVKIVKKDVSDNHKEVSKIASELARDPHAPLTPETYKAKIKISTGRPNTDDDGRNRF
jgi:hypothetical protein